MIPYPIDEISGHPWTNSRLVKNWAFHKGSAHLVYSLSGTNDPRKGTDLLQAALQSLAQQVRDQPGVFNHPPELVIIGDDGSRCTSSFPFPVHFRGVLTSNQILRLHYAAADLLVIPSRQDNLPNTGLEAHACGLPVVGFCIGGLPDIVDDRVTGALAEPFEPLSMARAIQWVLADPDRLAGLRAAARRRAVREWSPARIADCYSEIYRQLQ